MTIGKKYSREKKNRNPAGIYLLKFNNRNARARCETCSKLTIKYQNDATCNCKPGKFGFRNKVF